MYCDCILLCDDDSSQTGSNKVSSQTSYFIASGFPWAIEAIEPSSARLVSALLFSVLELPVLSEHLSQIRKAIFRVLLLALFSQIRWNIGTDPLVVLHAKS